MGVFSLEQEPLPEKSELDSGKLDISNLRSLKIGAGSQVIVMDKEGQRFGSHLFDDAKAYIKTDGSFKFKNSAGDVLIDSNNVDGDFINIINQALDTSSQKILKDFTFEDTDYAGAFKSGDVTWNAATGLPTGGTGVLINDRGIMLVKDGTATITFDGSTGDGTFAGTLSAATGTLGTITSANITGGTITGVTVQTATTGYRVKLTSSQWLQFLYGDTEKGSIGADTGDSLIYTSLDNHIFRDYTAQLCEINGDGISVPNAAAFYITSGAKMSYSGGYLRFEGASGGDVGTEFQGDVIPEGDNEFNLGLETKRWSKGWFEDISVDDITVNSAGSITIAGHTGDDEEFEVGTSFREDGGNYQWKGRLLTFKKGVLTNLGDESDWRTIS